MQQKQMANDRQAYEEAAEHANALISELQESNQQLSEELEAADAKVTMPSWLAPKPERYPRKKPKA